VSLELISEDWIHRSAADMSLVDVLAAVESQGRQLTSLRQIQACQRQRLVELKERAELVTSRGAEQQQRPVVVRSAHCKRDACCGPGRLTRAYQTV